ncbi:3-hydroxybutyryl-CoA dehydrogenase [Hanamia caeni]|uniref:3-hydroxybutyryl-CoA dehydrogenase n=1 Tax=Hanamia caeni TaxID=2294116 RepID=A0A3M9NHJ4_9BACT|nr:3-hydroxyacyl-CoA dehydrogenase NAD-binding domain-containing protein [Hanamia caeni]RNI37254.1 3-hydroxybutyryl-CoA dehydrogenase [Hanamia caeni]
MTIPIAVCGAGTMGSGIAQVAAQTNFETVLFDVDETMLEKAKVDIAKNLQYLVEKGKMDLQEKHEILHRIKFTSDISDCTAFVIIEAIVEKEKAKISLFTDLSKYNNEEVIFASNTSSLSISKIQQQVPFPQRVIGMHFFNPPYIMKLVEVVKGAETNDEVITAIMDICRQMGKVPVLCKDSPGFIVNRVARQYYLESLKIAEEEIASFENIDKILEASGFKMGPFRLMDLIGLDINLATTESIYHAFNETSRFIPSAIQKEKVKQSLLGKKTGRGFYNYKQE